MTGQPHVQGLERQIRTVWPCTHGGVLVEDGHVPPGHTCTTCGSRPIEIAVGQAWHHGTAYVRVQGFSNVDGWVKVREIGGERSRGSYPPIAFANGGFVREADG